MEKPLYLAFAANHPVLCGATGSLMLLTFGILFIYWEINRPGHILPGAFGLSFTLLAVAALLQHAITVPVIVLVVSAVALFALCMLRPQHALISLAATLALTLGFVFITRPRPQPALAIGCGLLLGVATSLLTRMARRARANKQVN